MSYSSGAKWFYLLERAKKIQDEIPILLNFSRTVLKVRSVDNKGDKAKMNTELFAGSSYLSVNLFCFILSQKNQLGWKNTLFNHQNR